jgi:chitin synthase
MMTSHVNEVTKVPYCDKKNDVQKNLVALIPNEQVVAWHWALLIAFSVPELGAWIRSLRLCFFKKVKTFGWHEFAFVFAAESLHTVGICLLVYAVLPELDSIQGAMLTNCVCLVPGMLCK